MKEPRQYSLIKFSYDGLDKDYHKYYPFGSKSKYIYLGEIPNMLGHCIVACYATGRLYSGYHIQDFVEIDDDENIIFEGTLEELEGE